MFGKSNRWIGDKVFKPADNFLKESKLLSRIITRVIGVGLNKAGYGCRPRGKHPQIGCGAGHSQYGGIGSIYIPKGLPMRAKPIYIKHKMSYIGLLKETSMTTYTNV